VKTQIEYQAISSPWIESPTFDHSTHIISFIKAVVEDRDSKDVGSEATEITSSLRNLVKALENPAAARGLSFSETKVANRQVDPCMPPLDATVAVMRWAKGSLLTMKRVSRTT
jgi:hypothetical protein